MAVLGARGGELHPLERENTFLTRESKKGSRSLDGRTVSDDSGTTRGKNHKLKVRKQNVKEKIDHKTNGKFHSAGMKRDG